MSNIPEQSFSISDLQRFVGSDTGKALISYLRSNGGAGLNTALEKAAAGDTADARQLIEGLLSSKEARELLDNTGGYDGK